MARTRPLSELVTIVRQRTNMENSEFVTDDEITDSLNEEWAELWGRLTLGENQPHFVSTTTISVELGTTLYALSADFYKLLRLTSTVDRVTRDMEPFMEGERAALENTQYFTPAFLTGSRYRLQGDNVEFLPVTRAFTANVRYIRACPVLIEDSDTLDGFNGYEAIVLAGACALVREKEETDPSFFERRKDRLLGLIAALAAQRDASHPERVTDTVGMCGGDGWLP
jgi:hypothetical protein